LITPLNWGLGHATRCIPIIRELLSLQCKVSIASDGSALELLKEEFPELPAFELPAYNITYKYGSLATNIFMQLPKMTVVYKKEGDRVKELYKKHQWDIIISDCRYGVNIKGVRNILISHQLNIHFDNVLLKKQANLVNRRFMKAYQDIWVPDYEDHRLSGSLSEKSNLENVFFLGAVSRMFPQRLPQQYDLIVVLSGPEPNRTQLEEKLWSFLSETAYSIAWVRGINKEWNNYSDRIEIFQRLGSDLLNQLMNSSRLVISRSGYTTVMDMYSLNKKAILIPTPGQSEQEYLGTWLENHSLFDIIKEDDLEKLLPLIATHLD